MKAIGAAKFFSAATAMMIMQVTKRKAKARNS